MKTLCGTRYGDKYVTMVRIVDTARQMSALFLKPDSDRFLSNCVRSPTQPPASRRLGLRIPAVDLVQLPLRHVSRLDSSVFICRPSGATHTCGTAAFRRMVSRERLMASERRKPVSTIR